MPGPHAAAVAATVTLLGFAFTLICKPEQSGKTFVMIQQIIKDLGDSEDNKKVINFIFCANSLLLTKQTSQRINKVLTEYIINGERYIEFSSHKRTECNNAAAVYHAIVCRDVRNIICCTNGKRVTDIQSIIDDINRSPNFNAKENFVFKVWLDEADQYTKFIDKVFRPLTSEQKNVEVNLLTATPHPLFNKYKGMKVFPLENTTLPDYHGWNDNIIEIREPSSSTFDFVTDVLDEQQALGTILPGTKWYIPADREKKKHYHMEKRICKSFGFAVFVVNGDGITLARPGHPDELINKDKELNTLILEKCKEYELSQYPIAITGNICIGRGISIMSPEFIFDYGILSNCAKKAEASQNAGRLKGNIKNWPNYKQPTVFTTAKFDKIAKEFEEKSRRLAVLAYEKQQNSEETIMTKCEFKNMSEDFEYVRHPELFNSMKEVENFFAQEAIYKDAMKLKKAPIPGVNWTKSAREKCGGYAVSSKLHKVATQTAALRLTIDTVANISISAHITKSGGGSSYLVLPVYENMETPPDQEKYEVRYLKWKK